MKGAIANEGRQMFVTGAWLEWRRQVAPRVPTFAEQLAKIRALSEAFDSRRREGPDSLKLGCAA